jgi:hypothetical protein
LPSPFLLCLFINDSIHAREENRLKTAKCGQLAAVERCHPEAVRQIRQPSRDLEPKTIAVFVVHRKRIVQVIDQKARRPRRVTRRWYPVMLWVGVVELKSRGRTYIPVASPPRKMDR